MSQNIQAIVFDIGNVLLKFNYLIAAERLRLVNGLEELPPREPITDAQNALEAGRISREEFLAIAKREFRHTGSDESFLQIWRDIFAPNEPMIALVRELAQEFPLFLISNISCIHREYIFATYDFFRLFRAGAFSYELGCTKPEREIYERARRLFGYESAELLLFDDMPENVHAALETGWNALHYNFRRHGEFLGRLAAVLPSSRAVAVRGTTAANATGSLSSGIPESNTN